MPFCVLTLNYLGSRRVIHLGIEIWLIIKRLTRKLIFCQNFQIMLEARSLKIIEFFLKVCGLMGSIPYDWDRVEECVAVCYKFSRKASVSFAVIHSAFYGVFLLWRLAVLVGSQKPSYFAIVWQWNWINMITWALVTFYNAHQKKTEVAAIFRGLKKFNAILRKGG